MLARLRRLVHRPYERLLEREIDGAPSHVAVIQDGNRRYAREQGGDAAAGHRAGAETTEDIIQWCDELGVAELTLYAFSTENFERDPAEREELFDLIERKLYEFADHEEVHANEVRIRAIGELDRLPPRVREAVDFAEHTTRGYDRHQLNVALAYGGRAELLGAAREIAESVAAGELAPAEIDVETVESHLYDGPTRDVDLIIRTGGDERTSNFLPWHANGNEAAVYFCTPYWPEFRRIDFLRAVRTYESRRESWRRTRARRAIALLRSLRDVELEEARRVLGRFGESVPRSEVEPVEDDRDPTP